MLKKYFIPEPRLICDDYKNTIPVIWSNSIAFQKFQRYVSNEESFENYNLFIKNYSYEFMPLYSSDAEILNSDAGEYQIRVFSFNGLGEPSRQPAELTFTAVGKTAPPSDITNLTYEPISDKEIRLKHVFIPVDGVLRFFISALSNKPWYFSTWTTW